LVCLTKNFNFQHFILKDDNTADDDKENTTDETNNYDDDDDQMNFPPNPTTYPWKNITRNGWIKKCILESGFF